MHVSYISHTPYTIHPNRHENLFPNQCLSRLKLSPNLKKAVDSSGRTALPFVSGLDSGKCVKLLAEAGANLDHRDNSGGLTTLHMAAGYVQPAVVKQLVELGADPVVEDDRGLTPLDLAKRILNVTTKRNTMPFGRRIVLESVVKVLDGQYSSTPRCRIVGEEEERETRLNI